jgi:predicted metal-dependent phosphoesterase TrpH
MRTVEKLKKQNAFISIPHPFDRQRSTFWKSSLMKEILPYIDALEVFNARCVLPAYNKQAEAFANENGKLKLAGSDAHSTIELGKASLLLPEFHDAESLRISLLDYEFDGELSNHLVHILSSYAKLAKRFKKVR